VDKGLNLVCPGQESRIVCVRADRTVSVVLCRDSAGREHIAPEAVQRYIAAAAEAGLDRGAREHALDDELMRAVQSRAPLRPRNSTSEVSPAQVGPQVHAKVGCAN
jgi:hypothetical protein